MARVVWSPEALASLDRITAYIAQFGTSAADRNIKRLVEAGNSLAEFSLRGRPTPDGCREMVRVWPHVIKYEVGGQAVDILSIRHMAQRR